MFVIIALVDIKYIFVKYLYLEYLIIKLDISFSKPMINPQSINGESQTNYEKTEVFVLFLLLCFITDNIVSFPV